MSDTEWHLDKRVPVALILGLLMQTGGVTWWASSINERVHRNETAIIEINRRNEIAREVSQGQAIQLGRIEEQITGLRADLLRFLQEMERNR